MLHPRQKYENIRALAKKQLQAVTESSDRWKAFLRTAAIAYNYSFPNQLLIHEQSPTATAVADIAYWNNNAGRWVKRGAHGIAVFDTRANSSRLRYLFDISDTIPRAEVPEALPWVITDQNWRPVWDKIVADNHADSIQSALLMLSTSCVAQRSAMFTTALGKAIDGSRHGAGVGDIEGQHDAEDDVQHQHEDHVAGHVSFHGL